MLNAGEEPETPSDPPTEVGYASLLSQKQENETSSRDSNQRSYAMPASGKLAQSDVPGLQLKNIE